MGSTWACLRSSARLWALATRALASGEYRSRWIVCSAAMEWQRYSKVNMPADVTVYVTQTCPYCVAAKQLLNKRGARFVEVDVSGGDAIGGYDELAALDRAGKLTEKLAGTQSPSQ